MRKTLSVHRWLQAFLFVSAFGSTASATTYVPPGSSYTSATTWTLAGSPYVIQSTLTVAASGTLTIQPGVIVKFGSADSFDRLIVYGTLNVNGSPTQHVTFTSIEDDSIGGDTGGNGPSQGAPGQWQSINVYGSAVVSRADVRFGGIQLLNGSTSTLDFTSVRYGSGSGLSIGLCVVAATVRRSDFSANVTGISISSSGACSQNIQVREGTTVTANSSKGISILVPYTYAGVPITVMNSDIINNGQYGLYLQVASGTPVASQPYGHGNNIFGNGGGANGRQLWAGAHLPQSDWTSNYWGDVREAVECPWAAANTFPWHLSYQTPNPYQSAPNSGSVTFEDFTKTENNQLLHCGADKVKDYPYAAAIFDNTVFLQPTCNPVPPGATAADINYCLASVDFVSLMNGVTYNIDQSLVITRSNSHFTGQGANDKPKLLATSGLSQTILVTSNNPSNFEIGFLDFDGNRAARPDSVCVGEREPFSNIALRGNGWTVHDVRSENTLCGSALVASGIGVVIRDSEFVNNGGDTSNPQITGHSPWSDGLTLLKCSGVGAHVFDNTFADNTDVGLVVGGSAGIGGCIIELNKIWNQDRRAFAGLGIGWFPEGQGNHEGIQYRENFIDSALNQMAYGLIAGFEPWFNLTFAPGFVTHAGDVRDNHIGDGFAQLGIGGAVINLAVDGISQGVIANNITANAQGNRVFDCSAPPFSNGLEYAVHFVGYRASVPPGGFPYWGFGGHCGTYNQTVPQPGVYAALMHEYTDQHAIQPNTYKYSSQDQQQYRLGYQGPDGNLVLEHYNQGTQSWNVVRSWLQAEPGYPPHIGGIAKMQSDGNFVVYDINNVPQWSTVTQGYDGAYLVVQNDGNVVVYDIEGIARWSIF